MIESICEQVRASILDLETIIDATKKDAMRADYDVKEGEIRGEVIENLTLAYRHLEDARMRLGKVYQARNGGISNSER